MTLLSYDVCPGFQFQFAIAAGSGKNGISKQAFDAGIWFGDGGNAPRLVEQPLLHIAKGVAWMDGTRQLSGVPS